MFKGEEGKKCKGREIKSNKAKRICELIVVMCGIVCFIFIVSIVGHM